MDGVLPFRSSVYSMLPFLKKMTYYILNMQSRKQLRATIICGKRVCVCCFVAHCKTGHVLQAPHLTMDVQEQESLGRWYGVGSRDAISRVEAMENIRQVVMTKVEAIKPIPSGAHSPPASGSPPSSDLNEMLAHLLMLSKRCPFEDVRESSSCLLQYVQVRVKTL